MSDQPKPTGEWTGLALSRLIKKRGYKATADIHNAAINAERQKTDYERDKVDEVVSALNKAPKQLAAEREKVQTLVDVLKDIRVGAPNVVKQQIKDALAKVKVGK